VPSYVAVQNTPTVMGNDKEAIENSESEARHSEEIHCSDGLTMVLQEDAPALGWFRVLRCALHPARDGSLGNIETEFQQLAVDARGTPSGILNNHAENQLSQVFTDPLPAEGFSTARDPIPVKAESGAMPAYNGFGSNDNKSLLPSWSKPFDNNPK
jgi:hypothetical protein